MSLFSVVEVPSRVKDEAASRAAALQRMGGEALASHALDRTLPLEYHISSRTNVHPLVGTVIDAGHPDIANQAQGLGAYGNAHANDPIEAGQLRPTHRVILRVRTAKRQRSEMEESQSGVSHPVAAAGSSSSSSSSSSSRAATATVSATITTTASQRGPSRQVTSVEVMGVASRLGTFCTPADYAFVGALPRTQSAASTSNERGGAAEPVLAVLPYRFDGPLSSIVQTKESSVQHRYQFQPSPAPIRNAKYSGGTRKEQTSTESHIIPYGAKVPTTAPRSIIGRQRRGAFRKRYDKTLTVLRAAFQQRPIWRLPVLAWALEPKLVESVGMESEPVHDISECLPEVAYKLSSGPWISCWVRIGYSPAEQPAARVMQVSGGPFLSHRAEPHTMTAPHAAPLPTGPGCAVREKADELCPESIKGREHWWYFKGSRSGAS